MNCVFPELLFIISACLQCRSAPTAQSTVRLGIAQIYKGQLLPHVREMCKVSPECRRLLQPITERTGGSGGYLSFCWQVIATCVQHCRVTLVLALQTISGFSENTAKRHAELCSCTSAEIPVEENCFHSHFWACRQVLIQLK